MAGTVVDSTKKSGLWVALLIISLAIGVGFAYGFYSETEGYGLAYRIGYIFGTCLIFWLVFYLAFRRMNKAIAGLSILPLLGAAIFGSFASEYLIEQRAEASKTRIGESLISFLEQAGDTSLDSVQIQIDQSESREDGVIGEVEKFSYFYMQELARIQDEYLADLQSSGWIDFFVAERISNDVDMVYSFLILEASHSALDEYIIKYNEVIANIPGQIDSLDLSQSEKNELEKHMNEGLVIGKANAEKMFNLEREYISTAGELMLFLKETQGDWIVEDGQFLFFSENNIELFNEYFFRISDIEDRQMRFNEQNLQNAQETFGLE